MGTLALMAFRVAIVTYVHSVGAATWAVAAYNAVMLATSPVIAALTLAFPGLSAVYMGYTAAVGWATVASWKFVLAMQAIVVKIIASVALMAPIYGALVLLTGAVLLFTGASLIAENVAKKRGEQLEKESKLLQEVVGKWNKYRGAVEGSTGGAIIMPKSKNVVEDIKTVGENLKNLGAEDQTKIWKSLEYDLFSLTEEIDASTEKLRTKIDERNKLMEEIKRPERDKEGETTYPGDTAENREKLSILNASINSLKPFLLVAREGARVWIDISAAILKVTRAVKDLTVEYEIMKSTDAFKNAKEEIAYLIIKIKDMKELVKDQGIDVGGMLSLRPGDTEGMQMSIRALKRVSAEYDKTMSDPKFAKESPDGQILIAKSTNVKQLITLTEKLRDAGKANNDKTLNDSKSFIDRQKALNNMNLDDEIEATKNMLKQKNLTVEQTKELNEKLSKLKRDHLVQDREDATRELSKELDAVKLLTNGQVAAYNKIIAKIKEKRAEMGQDQEGPWAPGKAPKKEGITEKQAYDLTKEAETGIKSSSEKDQKDNYDRQAKIMENYYKLIDKEEGMSNDNRLELLDSMERAIYEMERRRVYTHEQATDLIMKNDERRATLLKKIADANKAAEVELINLRKGAIDADIKRLETKLKAGDNVTSELIKKQKDAVDIGLKAVAREDKEKELRGISPIKREEFVARGEAAVFGKQADDIAATITALQEILRNPELGAMQRMTTEGAAYSLAEQEKDLRMRQTWATGRGDSAQRTAEIKGIGDKTEKTPFESATGVFSTSVGTFATIIQQFEAAFLGTKKDARGQDAIPLPSTGVPSIPGALSTTKPGVTSTGGIPLPINKQEEGSPDRQAFYRKLLDRIEGFGDLQGPVNPNRGQNFNTVINVNGQQSTGDPNFDAAAKAAAKAAQDKLKYMTGTEYLRDLSIPFSNLAPIEGMSY